VADFRFAAPAFFFVALQTVKTVWLRFCCVLICSMKPADFLTLIESPSYQQDCQDWGKQIGLFDLNEKAKLFQDYIEAHSAVPRYWEEDAGGASGAHWSQSLEVCLRSNLGWTSAEIDSEPLSKAFADYFKYAESQGSIRLMSQDEIAFIEAGKVASGV
jgi:hypothetical protein